MTKKDKTPADRKKDAITNIKYIILYSLALVTSLAFNELVQSSFTKFLGPKQEIFSKAMYFIIMFIFSILIAYWLSSTFSS